MEENQLGEYLHKQQDQILTLQILLQSLIDELIDTKIVDETLLENRTAKKIFLIKEELEKIKKQSEFIIPFNFGGRTAEA